MSNIIEYGDLIAFHPGSYIEEIIEDSNISQDEFAKKLGLSNEVVNDLINGKQNVDIEIANKLSKVTGISAQSWLNIQLSYSSKAAKIKSKEKAQ